MRGTSPYTGVNIYFGGRNRGCAQPDLTATWVRSASAAGWSLIPTYFGDQPFCAFGSKPYRYAASGAAARGSADGTDAVALARGLGLLPGSALYADVEHYDRTDASCVAAVRTYVSEWTRALHRNGYLAGVYVHQDSGLRDLAEAFSTSLARPDAVWMARWDNVATLTGWPTAGNTLWAEWQRAKQYRGDHVETWGGVSSPSTATSSRARGHRRQDVPRHQHHTAQRPQRTDGHLLHPRPAPAGQLRRRHLPGPRPADRDHVGLGPHQHRWLRVRPLRVHAVEHGFSTTLPRCSYPGRSPAPRPSTRVPGPARPTPTSTSHCTAGRSRTWPARSPARS